MSDLSRLIWCALIGLFRSRAAVEAEVLVRRHQLNVLRRKSPKRVAYGQKIHLRRLARSRRFAMVITQEPTQSFAALHGPLMTNVRIPRERQDIAPSLVVSPSVEMLDIFAERSPQRVLTEENHLGQALLLH